ncbi:aminotransferase class I/II-fold pyridoxal phosphate-dependent enzyme [Rhodovulum sulfidophilum]|uniref:aminotransferase class I/II-fold pyridoxal phosphate-dependent enzyme n=1 Tax=Rhodovulum sulfidophilum TaxID=35806 RepID=UPI001389F893|nr:aminotransferase class I/II-fold pyridoxal phosphate-dependent enzyme [Rhodovulum sulfidophilum]NDK33932.1 aminotransferase class I/II-fold pyridoxal phosphate-dependent enzyme [Rhodovulum sulfidophilum]
MPGTRDTLDRLRALHVGTPRNVAAPKPAAAGSGRADFTTHPAYRQVAVAQSAARALELENPFFRETHALEGTRVRIGERWVENFSGYDYLSINGDPRLAAAVGAAVAEFGVSARASRLVGGDLSLHRQLETGLARFLGTEAALATVSGHATNLAAIRTLTGPGDVVLVDSFAHNSVFEGLRASGADHVSLPHNDSAWLEDWLSRNRERYDRVLIVVEGLYSMDGDIPDLAALVRIKDRFEAWLMVDEAHSVGVLGATGRGLCEEAGIAPGQVDLLMGTLSKTFCSCGGFLAGSEAAIEILRHSAPGFVYSVGLSVPNTAAALTALEILEADPERVARLKARSARFLAASEAEGLDCGLGQGFAVAPLIVGDSLKATLASNRVFEDGFQAFPIIAPAVPNQKARLRFFINADHSEDVIDAAVASAAARIREVGGARF